MIEKILDRHMTNAEGAASLGLTIRQVIRLKKTFSEKGEQGNAAIDDATGTVVGAIFRPVECREGYSIVMQQGIKKHGIPLGLYSDRHTIFRSPKEKLSVEQELAGETKPLSNFGKAMA